MKRCFKCKRKKFIFLFKKDSSTYQLKSSFGKSVLCRWCSIKRAFKEGGVMKRVEGKFTFIKLNKIQIIKYFLSN
jgi:hypothetical protein